MFFFRSVYMFFEQAQIFQEGLSNGHALFKEGLSFAENTLLSHQTDTNFPRNPYLVPKHIHIFQEPLFSPSNRYQFSRTPSIFSSNGYSFSRKPYLVLQHISFSQTLLSQTHWHFPGRYPYLTDILLIGLGDCFRISYI